MKKILKNNFKGDTIAYKLYSFGKTNKLKFSHNSCCYTEKTLHTKAEIKNTVFSSSHFYSDWSLVFIIFGFSLIAIFRYYYAKYIESSLFSVLNYNNSVSFIKENIKTKVKTGHLLNILYCINISLFACQLAKFYEQDYFSESIFMVFGILVASFFVIQKLYQLINIILGRIFNMQNLAREYNHNILIFNNIRGISLLPVVTFMAFSNPDFLNIVVYASMIIFLFLYLLKVYRLFEINLKKHINIFYFFLYLCSVEILPVFIVIKSFNILIYNV